MCNSLLPRVSLTVIIVVLLHSMVAWVAANLPRAIFVSYEQVRPDDGFAATMLQTLGRRSGKRKTGTQSMADRYSRVSPVQKLAAARNSYFPAPAKPTPSFPGTWLAAC